MCWMCTKIAISHSLDKCIHFLIFIIVIIHRTIKVYIFEYTVWILNPVDTLTHDIKTFFISLYVCVSLCRYTTWN